MKLVFEKITELFQVKENDRENYEAGLIKEISEYDDKENLNIQVKSSKRFSEVSEKEVRKRTCISNE